MSDYDTALNLLRSMDQLEVARIVNSSVDLRAFLDNYRLALSEDEIRRLRDELHA